MISIDPYYLALSGVGRCHEEGGMYVWLSLCVQIRYDSHRMSSVKVGMGLVPVDSKPHPQFDDVQRLHSARHSHAVSV